MNSGKRRSFPAHLLSSLRKRLPGGEIFEDLIPDAYSFRYGPRVALLRFLRSAAVYCIGGRLCGKNRRIGELGPPYPALYHFTPEDNAESILEKGILMNRGVVYLTDWTDAGWLSRLRPDRKKICFRVDTKRLAASGHRVSVLDNVHEFTTDHVPPDCLTLMPENEKR